MLKSSFLYSGSQVCVLRGQCPRCPSGQVQTIAPLGFKCPSPVRICLLQAGLPGFYDPCVGEEKNLKVLYQFRGVLHQVMALDSEALRIPKQCE